MPAACAARLARCPSSSCSRASTTSRWMPTASRARSARGPRIVGPRGPIIRLDEAYRRDNLARDDPDRERASPGHQQAAEQRRHGRGEPAALLHPSAQPPVQRLGRESHHRAERETDEQRRGHPRDDDEREAHQHGRARRAATDAAVGARRHGLLIGVRPLQPPCSVEDTTDGRERRGLHSQANVPLGGAAAMGCPLTGASPASPAACAWSFAGAVAAVARARLHVSRGQLGRATGSRPVPPRAGGRPYVPSGTLLSVRADQPSTRSTRRPQVPSRRRSSRRCSTRPGVRSSPRERRSGHLRVVRQRRRPARPPCNQVRRHGTGAGSADRSGPRRAARSWRGRPAGAGEGPPPSYDLFDYHDQIVGPFGSRCTAFGYQSSRPIRSCCRRCASRAPAHRAARPPERPPRSPAVALRRPRRVLERRARTRQDVREHERERAARRARGRSRRRSAR